MKMRNKFSLSYTNLFSCSMGELVPIGWTEVLPGDTFQHATSLLLRASPLLTPVMHPVNVDIFHFYVPFRLLWEKWEEFITAGPGGLDASAMPVMDMPAGTGALVGSLADYLGIPTGVASLRVSALPFRAYAEIFNQWFRDQDLTALLGISKASGVDVTTNSTLQNAAWEKDYFTSARPWESKGPSVIVPIGDAAPVVSTGAKITLSDVGGAGVNNSDFTYSTTAPSHTFAFPDLTNNSDIMFGNSTGLEADLSAATGVDINDLREAFALQRFQENRALFGSRFTEYLRALGIKSSDARLQRPEFLGSGRQVIQFSEVLQTAEGADPVGTLRGHGIAAMRSNRYMRFFEENGIVMSLMAVRPKTIYMQGLSRAWNRRSKTDYWQPELEHVGQQPVLNKEIYAAHPSPDATFGYQDRYDEYRRSESRVAGEFRTTLNMWHLAREFSSSPALNSTFVVSNPTDRVFAVPSEDTLWIMAKHQLRARRLLSKVARSFIF